MLLNESKGWLDQSKVEGGVELGSMIWGVDGDGRVSQALSELLCDERGKRY